ncbi:hypothetical protein ROE7235_03884 [Roseibaca ekhonensis]|uniref:Uncharacterized protein n=1 Tax=Roseinatronobacter ekhonensis TaxID=254356 RepID=A0A3B0MEA5_9RHOB|nr:hypothetical protein ROE7235_03884 [Roseibaca ekhonensis]
MVRPRPCRSVCALVNVFVSTSPTRAIWSTSNRKPARISVAILDVLPRFSPDAAARSKTPGSTSIVWAAVRPAIDSDSIASAVWVAVNRVRTLSRSAASASAFCSSAVARDTAPTFDICASKAMAGFRLAARATAVATVAMAWPFNSLVFRRATSCMAVPCAICAAPNRSTRSAAPWIFCMAARAGAVA